MDLNFTTADSYVPDFRARIVGHCTPDSPGLEKKHGLAGADIFHDAPGIDRLCAVRAMLGRGVLRTPLKSLYFRGSGAHPGGGIAGKPAH